VSGQLHEPAASTPGKEPPLSIGQDVGWAPQPALTLWCTETFLALAGNRTQAAQPLAIPTDLSRLLFTLGGYFVTLILSSQ
jgi:hypothetical protein